MATVQLVFVSGCAGGLEALSQLQAMQKCPRFLCFVPAIVFAAGNVCAALPGLGVGASGDLNFVSFRRARDRR